MHAARKDPLCPMLFTTLKSYSPSLFAKDAVAGLIVAIIALPLSIALALASGVGPEEGLYTAIAAGFVISALGGSTVQIAGLPRLLPPLWPASLPAAAPTACSPPRSAPARCSSSWACSGSAA